MDGAAQPHECIYTDEAGLYFSKNKPQGHNIIGQRAIVHIPRQRVEGDNITLCAGICLNGLLHCHATLGPCNSQHTITFPDAVPDTVFQDRPEQPRLVVVWSDASFHQAALVQNRVAGYLLPYSQFLNLTGSFFLLGDGRYMTANLGRVDLFCSGTGLRRH